MANIKIEVQFIQSLLDGKFTIQQALDSGLSERHFTSLSDSYEFILEYYHKNGSLPSHELVSTKNTLYQPGTVTDNPADLVIAIKDSKNVDIFYDDIQRAMNLLKTTGNVRKAVNYIQEKLELFQKDDEPDVFEFTSPDFQAGELDYTARNKAFVEKGVYGIPTGFGYELDNHLNGGWISGNLYGLAGNTGVGKSWVAMATSRGGLLEGKKVLYVALEGTVAKEYYRFLTITTEAFNTQLQNGSMNLEEFKFIQRQMREIAAERNGKFYLATFGNRDEYTPSVLRNKIETYKPDMVITDYLTLMSDGTKEADNWETYLRISKKLKGYAVRFQIPLIAILQGTISMMNSNKMETANIAQSKGIARDFDWIGGINRVPNKQNIIRLNSMKVRDSDGEFDAFYQTGWNSGKVKFLEMVGESESEF